MRRRLIVIGLAAALAVGGLSAYAASTHGSTVRSAAQTTTLEGAARGDAVSDVARLQGGHPLDDLPHRCTEIEGRGEGDRGV